MLPVHLALSLVGVAVEDRVSVAGDEAHHAVAVRRLRVGEAIVLTDGAGIAVTGTVATTGRRVFTVTVSAVEQVPEPSPAIVVVQALPKGDRGELAVEMLTEIGVSRIIPWSAARSVAVWRGERAEKSLARWRTTAREAAKQSRRPWHPDVAELASTADVADLVAGADVAIVLHEAAAAAFAGIEVPDVGEIVVVVGPEGGLTDEEVTVLVDAGARSVRLGVEVLRSSTAGVAATAALLARTSRWRT